MVWVRVCLCMRVHSYEEVCVVRHQFDGLVKFVSVIALNVRHIPSILSLSLPFSTYNLPPLSGDWPSVRAGLPLPQAHHHHDNQPAATAQDPTDVLSTCAGGTCQSGLQLCVDMEQG